MSDDDYSQMQTDLAGNPQKGTLIKNSGGLYKLRWGAKGRGKRGGVRVIYYWVVAKHNIYMLYVYPKSERDDLTPAQLRELRKIIEGK